MSSTTKKKAEQQFREAFERLKNNKPEILTKGAKITQNNIAREAGRDPSALKKDRYPLLLLEIQQYIQGENEAANQKRQSSDNRKRSNKQALVDCKKQRDRLASIVAAQNSYIEYLLDEINKLKTGKAISIESNQPTKI